MRVTSGKSQVREIRLPGSEMAEPNSRATQPQPWSSLKGELRPRKPPDRRTDPP